MGLTVLVVWLESSAIGSRGCRFIVGAWQVHLVMVARPVSGAISYESACSPGELSSAQQTFKEFAVPIA